jgi:ABC-type nickel/cobalt efflux system permease component RcnA
VVLVGAAVLRARLRAARHRHAHEHGHHHHHHDHHGQDHHHHGHDHHHVPDELSWRSLGAMGASAGLIPCPSALVVLLGAIAQHQVALGLVMITAFSLGLAATLTVLGLLVVHAGRLVARVDMSGRLVAVLPSVSALVIVAAGCVLTARALPGLT